MKKRIILHGHLAEKHPEIITVEAETIAEALQALTQYPELAHPPGEPWPIRIDGVERPEDLYDITPVVDIHLYPETGGAGGGRGGSVFQIILGIALISLAIWLGPASLGVMGMTFSSGNIFLAGAMMLTGGIMQLMMPTPTKDEPSVRSRIGNGAGNTTRMGTPIPLAYGTQLLGGHYISYNVDATEWNGVDDLTLDEKGAAIVYRYLPEQSSQVGVYPLPGTTNSPEPRQGVYAEVDKPAVQYALVAPVFQSQTTGPSNIPQTSWVI